MKYRWGKWSLDREAGLLKRSGQTVDASRKILECMDYLITHRGRVVGYDELIRKIWGHDDVANNRLSQLILSVRRLLGDDGHAQRFIRTAPGIGYQWVAALEETPPTPDSAAPQIDPASPFEVTSPMAADNAADSFPPNAKSEDGRQVGKTLPGRFAPAEGQSPASRPRGISIKFGLMLLSLSCLIAYRWLSADNSSPMTTSPGSSPAANSIASLEFALRGGDFEAVREGLAALPPSVAASPDAMLIAMQLDFYRGRYERAQARLDAQLDMAKAANDPIWQAKLLVFGVSLEARTGISAAKREATIQAALDLLSPLGEDAAPDVLADALRRRSAILLLQSRHEEALRDLTRSGELYERIGDARSAVAVSTDRARVWMRTGRLEDALRAMRDIAEDYRAMSDKVGMLGAYNTMTRIQMELLRWDDALETSDRTIALLREIPELERRKRVLQLRAQVLARLGRLRQARSLLDETETLLGDEPSSMIAIQYLMEAGNDAAVLKASATAFAQSDRDDADDILLETREGALLTWAIAAQRLADAGQAISTPSPAQVDALRNPRSIAGTIASGRWSLAQNDGERAESLLRQALDGARRKGMRYHMVLAVEPLLELLLSQGHTTEARQLLEDVRAFDRDRFDGDFHFVRMRLRSSTASGDVRSGNALYERLREMAGERPIPARPPRAPEPATSRT